MTNVMGHGRIRVLTSTVPQVWLGAVPCTLQVKCSSSRSLVRVFMPVFVLIVGSVAVAWNNIAFAQSTSTFPMTPRTTVRQVSQVDQADLLDMQQVTLEMHDSTVSSIVRALARMADRPLIFNGTDPRFSQRKSIRISKTDVLDAFDLVLKGTGLTAMLASDKRTIVVQPARVRGKGVAITTGGITGRVADSASGKAVSGVTVTIPELKRSTVTDEKGMFTFRDVPVGDHVVMVKLFGYRATSRPAAVVEGKSVNVQIRMVATATELSGVVTTATGTQRKIEVGNDITTINVDSVMKVMPVSTFTDLLATRVPGLTVMATSGAPGAPSKIRIRGLNSMNASNDPVVIVDGIRVNSAQTENSSNLAADSKGAYQLVSSPLDAIDPNSIETVEVFKGPSAVALYGTDAANGVIVVTTKRGQSGPARWSADGIWGQTTMPGTWPTNYMRFGTEQSGRVTDCSSVREATKNPSLGCTGIEGALLKYQLLNDPKTTIFGTGRTQTYRTTVSGGTRGFAYSFTGALNTELGLVKMPDADVQVLREAGVAIPGWQHRPQGSESQSGAAKVNVDLGKADVDFTTTLTRQSSRTTPLQSAISVASGLAPGGVDLTEFGFPTNPWSGIGSGVLREIPNFRSKTSSQNVTARNSLRVLAKPYRWIQTEATGGVEFTDRTDLSTLGRGECSTAFGGVCDASFDRGGEYNTGAVSGIVTSLILRASAPAISFARWMSLRPSVAGDYTRRNTTSVLRRASGLPAGATSGNGAKTQSMRDNRDERSTAGMYIETMLGFADRLYLPLSLRFDAGSGLGAKVRPTYPRISPSFLISDLPAFRSIPVIGRLETVRLRTAYGQSGVQPAVSAKLRTYTQVARIIDGGSVMSTELSSIGNSILRPERTSEIEGGADIEMLQGRFGMTLTGYRKRTRDALVSIPVPPSVNGGWKQQRNIGTVQNTGMEVTVNATLLQQRSAVWQINIGMSKNRNKLVKLGMEENIDGKSVSTHFVEGYPLYGLWALPITGFTDLNGDGWITTGVPNGIDEVQLGQNPVYLGAPYPVFESSLHSTVNVLRNISFGATFSYQHGLTQMNLGQSVNSTGLGLLNRREFNDPTTPVATQASLAVAVKCTGGNSACSSDIGVVQTISALRLNGFSFGFILPQRLTAAISRGRTIRIALQGTNFGLWTNYSGKDPNVNSGTGETSVDTGVLPTSRIWQFTIGVN